MFHMTTTNRKPSTIEWQHTATYDIDPDVDTSLVYDQLLDKDGDPITGVITAVTVTWYDPSGIEEGDDNDPLIRFYAKPLTSKGTVDRRTKAQAVFFSDTKDRFMCEMFQIDLDCPVPPI